MRVLFLNTSGKPGGAETSLLALIESLRRIQPTWQLHLLLGEDGPVASRAAALGVSVHLLSLPGQVAIAGDSPGSGLRNNWKTATSLPATVSYLNNLRALIKAIRPDVLHTNGIKMHLLTAWARSHAARDSSLVCHMHDYLSARPIAKRLMQFSGNRFDAIVANSRSVAADLARLGFSSEKVSSIHNGVCMARFTPEGQQLNLDELSGLQPARESTVRVGLIGTFAKWKGHFTFLRAISMLPRSLNIRGYVIGGPISRNAANEHTQEVLREEAHKLGVAQDVGFTGFVQDTPAAFRALDIVVHASTRPEPFGMVILEAMACGRPVIVTGGGGAAELFHNGSTAWTNEPGNAGALALSIEHLANHRSLRENLGKIGRAEAVNRFSAEIMAKRFADLYHNLVSARARTLATDRSTVDAKCFVLD